MAGDQVSFGLPPTRELCRRHDMPTSISCREQLLTFEQAQSRQRMSMTSPTVQAYVHVTSAPPRLLAALVPGAEWSEPKTPQLTEAGTRSTQINSACSLHKIVLALRPHNRCSAYPGIWAFSRPKVKSWFSVASMQKPLGWKHNFSDMLG